MTKFLKFHNLNKLTNFGSKFFKNIFDNIKFLLPWCAINIIVKTYTTSIKSISYNSFMIYLFS